MRIGAHISISKGLPGVVQKAKDMGANSVQVFVSPPRNWNETKFSTQDFKDFGEELKQNDITPNFLHGIYLVNLHTPNPETRDKAIRSVTSYMEAAVAIGAEGVIIHSHKPDPIFVDAIDEILEASPKETLFIIEHSAVTTLDQTLSLFKKVNSKRMGLCLDMCHLFAAGYDIREEGVVNEIIETIDRTIGLGRLKVIHANDCKSKFDSRRDHHENVSEGSIGKDAFKLWLTHPKLKHLPFILETPGFDDKGPDKANIDILKSLVHD